MMTSKHRVATSLFGGCLLLAVGSPTVQAADYYFDSRSGSDANSGITAAQAWKTLTRLRTLRLQPGDTAWLRRGSSFRGRLSFAGDGEPGKPVRIAAYGQGPKPEILGSIRPSRWRHHQGEVYACELTPTQFVGKQNVFSVYERSPGGVPVRLLRQDSGPTERGRFHFDEKTLTLRVITSDGAPPAAHGLEVSVVEQLVDLTNRNWVEMDGLAFLFGNCRHIVVSGCHDVTVRNCASLFVGFYGNPNIVIARGSERVSVLDCFLYENANCGVLLTSGSTACRVAGCTIVKCRSNDGITCHAGPRDANGVRHGLTGDHNLIESNVIGLCPEESIDITSGDYHVIRGNICYGNGNPGIIVGHDADHIVIENNICFGNRRAGIQVGGQEAEGARGENRVLQNLVFDNGYPGLEIQAKRTRVYNNTVVNSRQRVAVRLNEKAAGSELRNNLILTLDPTIPHPSLHFIHCTPESLGVKLSHNLFFHAGDHAKPDVFFPAGKLIRTDDGSFGLAAFFAKYGTGEHSLVARPKFAHERLCLLARDSPGVDAGIDVGLPFTGSGPDIGWKEVGEEASAPRMPEALVDGRDDDSLVLRLLGRMKGEG